MTDIADPAPGPERIAALDIVRGVAVLGILLMNIVDFALPGAAYLNPGAYGTHGALDLTVWAINAVLIDGRMRGLFSFLFGASLLLVVDRAEAAGRSAAAVHYRRMGWLLVFGLAHLFLLWSGDILQLYAMVGAVAFFARRLPVEKLVALGLVLVLVETVLAAGLPVAMAQASAAVHAAHPDPATLATYTDLQGAFGHPAPAALATEITAYRGSYSAIVAYRWQHARGTPLGGLLYVGPETLAYMFFGMAALRSGLLSGDWPRRTYRRWAALGFVLTVPPYAVLTWYAWTSGFTMESVAWTSLALATPLRPVAIVAWACLVLAIARPSGWLTGRVAAAGRMAFTNYLATSLICTTIFYGYGLDQFARWQRAPLYLLVLSLWAAMLAWSAPWLARYRYGPLEWLWRSLARGRWQALRR